MSACPNPFLYSTDHTPYFPNDNVQVVISDRSGTPYITKPTTPASFDEGDILRFICNNMQSPGGRSLAPYNDISRKIDPTYHPKITCNSQSWDYTYGWGAPPVDIPEGQRVGPECQRPECPQNYHELNRLLDPHGFTLDYTELAFNGISKHPESINIQYHKNPEGDVILNRNKLLADSITVKCKDRPVSRTASIKCRYVLRGETRSINYDQSIQQLDSSICDEDEYTFEHAFTFNPTENRAILNDCASG